MVSSQVGMGDVFHLKVARGAILKIFKMYLKGVKKIITWTDLFFMVISDPNLYPLFIIK